MQTKEQFINNQISGLNAILNVLYVLLALSVIVSLFGIVNTLVLTVFERTREIGMLRAVGMTRRQVRRMIRARGVITALIGGVIGIVLGLVLGGLLAARIDFIVFALPWTQVVIFAVAAIIVGLLAAIFPARRAGEAQRARGAPVRVTPPGEGLPRRTEEGSDARAVAAPRRLERSNQGSAEGRG